MKFWGMMMLIAITMPMIISCDGKTETTEVKDSAKVDTLLAYLQKIDSLRNNGHLFHIDVYEIGKLKSVYFDVYNITSKGESAQYLNLKKDCGGQYYYDWEDAVLLQGEIKYFLAAADTIIANFDRPANHEERYIYVTNDDIRLFSSAWENRKWSANLSVDYKKKDATITLERSDLDSLKKLLINGEKKIISLRANKKDSI